MDKAEKTRKQMEATSLQIESARQRIAMNKAKY